MQSIVRVQHDRDRPYLTVSKETIRDHAVSWEARGFLMFLLAKPDDWQVRPEKLKEECGSSRSMIYRLLAQLNRAGYIRRDDIRRRKPDGTFESASLYTVFEDRKAAALHDEKIPF